jgi:hypothetical protein
MAPSRRGIAVEYGGQTRAGQWLSGLAQGFVQTRPEILLFFLLVVGVLLFFFLYFAVQKAMARRELGKHSREMLEHLLGKLDLDDAEIGLLGRLAAYLQRGESEHMLLVSHQVFDACARRIRSAEGVSEVQLNALRLKIGFRITQPEAAPASSTDLLEGSPVLLVTPAGKRTNGTVIAQGPHGILVKQDAGGPPPAKGEPLTVYFHNSAGIFSFQTRVTDLMDDAMHLEHSANIARYQRRRYYRRKESLPVFIRPASAAAQPRESLLLDLGGGGARLRNPEGMLKQGELLEMSFSPLERHFNLVGRVVRVSRNGKVLGVKFVSLPEAERNRIMGFLFAQSEHRRARPH